MLCNPSGNLISGGAKQHSCHLPAFQRVQPATARYHTSFSAYDDPHYA